MAERYLFSGSLPAHAENYVVRAADDQLFDALLAGQFCYVLNSRQTGKSSLSNRTQRLLSEAGCQCVTLDLSLADVKGASAESWYLGLLRVISKELFDEDVLEWWCARDLDSPLNRFRQYMEEQVFPRLDTPLILFIDEIDSVLSLLFNTDDFFAYIRACYNRRALEQTYNQLTFCLLGVASPNTLIQDPNRTPFNIGQAIKLKGFQLEDTGPLQTGFAEFEDRIGSSQELLAEILSWTGGQPFLTQKVCFGVYEALEEDCFENVEAIVQSQILENWAAKDTPVHLKTIEKRILVEDEYQRIRLELYRQVLTEGSIPYQGRDEERSLMLTGVVLEDGKCLKIGNKIYETVFSTEWVDEQFKSLRPNTYQRLFTAWVESNGQEDHYLLHGKDLEDAREWSLGKKLTIADYEYLDKSGILAHKQVTQNLLKAKQDLADIELQKTTAFNDLEESRLKEAKSRTNFKQSRRLTFMTTAIAITLGLAATYFSNQVLVSREEFKTSQKDLKTSQEELKTSREEFRTSQKGLKTSQKELKTSREEFRTSQEELKTSQEERNKVAEENKNLQEGSKKLEKQLDIESKSILRLRKTVNKEKNEARKFAKLARDNKSKSDNEQVRANDLQVRVSSLEGEQERLAKFNSIFNDGLNIYKKDISLGLLLLSESVKLAPSNLIALATSNITNILSDMPSMVVLHSHKHDSNSSGGIDEFAFNRDGSLLASASSDGRVVIWNFINKTQVKVHGFNKGVRYISFFENDSKLLVVFNTGQVSICPIKQHCNGIKFEKRYRARVVKARLHQNGVLAMGYNNGMFVLWDVNKRKSREFDLGKYGLNNVDSLAFDPNGEIISAAGRQHTQGENKSTIKKSRIQTFTLDRETLNLKPIKNSLIEIGGPTVNSLAFHPSKANILAAATKANEISIIDIDRGKKIDSLRGHNNWVFDLAFSADGRILTSASWDGTLRQWDASTFQPIGEPLSGHSGLPLRVVSHPKTGEIVSGDADATIIVWNPQVASNVSDLFALSSDPKDPMPWTIARNKFTQFSEYRRFISDVAFSSNGKKLATSLSDGSISILNPRTQSQIGKIKVSSEPQWSVAYSPDNQILASGGNDGKYSLFNAETLQPLALNLKPSEQIYNNRNSIEPITRLSFIKKHNLLAIMESTRNLYLCSAPSYQDCDHIEREGKGVTDIQFSPSQDVFVVAGFQRFEIWDSKTRQIKSLHNVENKALVSKVAFNHDGTLLAVATHARGIELWDMSTPKPKLMNILKKHPNWITDLEFSKHDHTHLLSMDFDGNVIRWDLSDASSPKELGYFVSSHQGWVRNFALNPIDSSLFSSGADNSVEIVRTGQNSIIDKICQIANRNFTQEEQVKYGLQERQKTCPNKP